MKIYVLHDASGAIQSVATVSEQSAGEAEFVAGEGQQVTVVDAAELRLPARDGEAPDLAEIAAHLGAHHRVEHGRLAPRGDAITPDGMIAAFGAKPAAGETPER